MIELMNYAYFQFDIRSKNVKEYYICNKQTNDAKGLM